MGVLPGLAITVIVGTTDPVAPPQLVRRYYEALTRGENHADWIAVEGGHDIFLAPAVLEATGRAITAN